MERLIEAQNNKEFIKGIQNWQSGISKEINGLKTIILTKKIKRCTTCGKEIKELRDSINKMRELLFFDVTDIRSLIRQRLISGYKRVEASEGLQKELEIWDEVESDGLDDDE